MRRSTLFLFTVVLPTLAFACNDEVVQDVPPEVCVSEKQWIGGKRGSPEMFPGRDCVGCHLENDGPELMLGGTIYPYIEYVAGEAGLKKYKAQQTGEDCFGLEGVELTITGGDGQEFKVTSNRAGNFYIEGKATDLVKPFSVEGFYDNPVTGMPDYPKMVATFPHYGGCARCHTPGVEAKVPDLEAGETEDQEVRPANALIGIGGLPNLSKLFPDVAVTP